MEKPLMVKGSNNTTTALPGASSNPLTPSNGMSQVDGSSTQKTSLESSFSFKNLSANQVPPDNRSSGSLANCRGMPYPTCETDFKQMLLDNLDDEFYITDIIHGHKAIPERIPVMAFGGKIYSLLGFDIALNHELPERTQQEVADTCFRLITYEQSAIETAPRSTVYKSRNNVEFVDKLNVKKAGQADVFFPLGYLTEPGDKDKAGPERVVNYVWALNISTKPKSLWLIYDYMTEDQYMTQSYQTSIDKIYSNIVNVIDEQPYTYDTPYLPDGFLKLGQPWDIVQVLDDVEKWQPENPIELKREDFKMRQLLGESLRAYTMKIPDSEYFEIGEERQTCSDDNEGKATSDESKAKSWAHKAWSKLQLLSKGC